MPSAFISYGGPDEAIASLINESLVKAGVSTFFFPDKAQFGSRLHHVMRDGVNDADKVVLLCSERALERFGVENEIEEALSREAAEGGRIVLIPIAIDDYVFTRWAPRERGLATALRRRVIANFSNVMKDKNAYDKMIERLIEAIFNEYPTIPISYKSHMKIKNKLGSNSEWVIKKKLLVNKGKERTVQFRDVEFSGNIRSFSSSSGLVKSIKKSGYLNFEITMNRIYGVGELIECDLVLNINDCHLNATEDLRSRIVAPYQASEWRVFLPSSRPAKKVEVIYEFGSKRELFQPSLINSANTEFSFAVQNAKMGSYYNLQWDW